MLDVISNFMEHLDIKKNIELGRKIFENIPNSLKPDWAGLILSRFSNFLIKLPEEVQELFSIIEDQNKWRLAHNQFTKIRMLSLNNNNFKPESYLILAEKVAKITYNSSNSPAPFDIDSGWYIPSLAIQTAESFEEPILKEKIISDIFIFKDNNNLLRDLSTTRIYLQEMRNN